MSGTRRWKRTSIAVLVAASVGAPAGAGAQDRVAVTLGGGGIFSADPPPAEKFAEPIFVASLQRVLKRYFVLEGELGYWAHASRFEYGPHDVFGPSGVIGRVASTTVIDDRKNWNVGLNFLIRSTGAVRVFSGAGIGFIAQEAEYSQSDTGCSPGLRCTGIVNARTRGPLPIVRAIAGVEVPITARLAIVGAVRAEAAAMEGSGSLLTAVTAVRFSFR